MFPISIEGQIEIEVKTDEDLKSILNGIEGELESAGATEIERNDGNIVFRGGRYRRDTRGTELHAVSTGEILMVPGLPRHLRYKFTCEEMCLWVAIFCALFGGILFWNFHNLYLAISLPLIFWLLATGLNYLIMYTSLQSFVAIMVMNSVDKPEYTQQTGR